MERYTLNYQLFKRNNMKKYLSLVMIGLSLMLSGCNKDDNNDPDTPPTGDTGKVRYQIPSRFLSSAGRKGINSTGNFPVRIYVEPLHNFHHC